MSAAELVLSMLLPLLAGAAVLSALGVRLREDALAFLGSMFPVGILLTGLVVFGWMSLGLALDDAGLEVVLGLAVVVIGSVAWWRRGSAPGAKREAAAERAAEATPLATGSARRIGELVFAVLLVLALSDVAFLALDLAHEPIVRGDSAGIWTIRAKMLFHHGAIDAELPEVLSRSRGASHLDYPLLGVLQQVWAMAVAGELLDAAVRWPTHLWHASLVLLVFGATRRRAGPLLGAGIAWLYLSLPQLPAAAAGTEMDLPVAVAFLGLVDRVLRWVERPSKHRRDVALALVWAGVLAWTKNEGLMLILATGLAAWLGLSWKELRARGRTSEIAFVAVPLLVVSAQWLFNQRFGFRNDILTGNEGQDPRGVLGMLVGNFEGKAGAIARFYGELTLDFHRSRHIYLLFLLALLLGGRAAWSRPARFVGLAVAFGWAGYFCAYVVSFQDLAWHLATSGARTAGHLLGVLTLFLACVLRGAWNGVLDRRGPERVDSSQRPG